ncbi:MAG: NAD(P)/FAD-dependent oxidoreductase, partial [Ilumatobacteraceae bacterium]
VIVGGGLIGLTSALALHERGAAVALVDCAGLGSGAARGNAGFLCPTLLSPLPGPGMLRTAARALATRDGPLRIRPRAVPSMLRWSVGFLRAANGRQFHAGRAALAEFALDLDDRLNELTALGVDVSPGGMDIVVPFHDVAFAERFHAESQSAGALGVPAPEELLDGEGIRTVVPALTDHVRAGFVLPGNRAIDPGRFVDSLIAALRSRDVPLLEHRRITGFDVIGDHVRAVRTSGGSLAADEVVLAAGAGIRSLGRMLGLRLEVVPGQGYNVALATSARLAHPVIVEEAHAVATPFADRIRLGGTVEFAGDSPPFDPRRVDAILRSMRPFLDLDWESRREAWAGSRPMSADGLPLIGRTRRLANVVVAGGHGMYGLTLAPSTARAVAELIVDGRPSTELAAFDPDR